MEPPSQPPANGARGAHGRLAPTHAGRAPGKGLDRSSTTMHGVAHATLATASQKSAITVRLVPLEVRIKYMMDLHAAVYPEPHPDPNFLH